MHLTIGGVFKVRSKDEDLINMMILETAEASNVPVGAGTGSVMLRKEGVNLSEAGAGRI